jgi:formylglycine-generating enzyme required for sulfatase activity
MKYLTLSIISIIGFWGLSALFVTASVTADPAPIALHASGKVHSTGATFRDCANVRPELVSIKPGSFVMGSSLAKPMNGTDEKLHKVTINYSFAVGKYDVTFAQWDACVADGFCGGYRPSDEGYGRGNRPVINVSWNDAQAYVSWLTRKTRKKYRLLSEAEWEYVARAGSNTTYYWGNVASHDFANYGSDKCCSGLAFGRDRWVNTSPVGSFPPNKFGLFDMSGNVIQWVEDCWHEGYKGAPADGSVWQSGDCSRRALRGGSWGAHPYFIRVPNRNWSPIDFHDKYVSFRVARTL